MTRPTALAARRVTPIDPLAGKRSIVRTAGFLWILGLWGPFVVVVMLVIRR